MSKDKLAQVFHFDLYGKREDKYEFLNGNSLASITFKELPNVAPNYFFVDKDFEEQISYDSGFSITELFPLNNVGIVTARDNFTIHDSKEQVEKTIKEFLSLDDESARNKFELGKDVRDWQVNFAKKDLIAHFPDKGVYTQIAYRPFDKRWSYYTGKSKGFYCYPRQEVMQHFTLGKNLGLIIGRQGQAVGSMQWNLSFITNCMTDLNIYYRGGGTTFPLYLYPETSGQLSIGESQNRVPNLNMDIVEKFASGLGFYFQPEQPDYSKQTEETNQLYPIYILDYIYAVLHSPAYREKYKEFLKIDFPRVPYPTNPRQFYDLVDLGSQLRALHLLESPEVENYITQYPIDGDNVVDKPIFLSSPPSEGLGEVDGLREVGRVYINPTQYFDKVPKVAWEFYIGGYQPAQKWLKDRKGRALSFEDILHYQKMIVALAKTADLMVEIDGVLEV
jgi:predicted helicase